MTRTPRLPRGSWRIALVRAGHGFMRHRGIDAAAALTFFMALTTFPAALVLVSAFALFDDRTRALDDLVAVARTLLPDDAATEIRRGLGELLSLGNAPAALVLGVILLLWTGSGYSTALGRAINAVYEVQEGRPFWAFRARMLVVAVVVTALAAAIATIVLVTPAAAADILGRRGIAPLTTQLWNVGKWPLLLLLLIVLIAVLYSATPNVRHTRVRWASIGSLAAVTLWVVATLGFALYIVVAGHYDALYGSLGGVLIALLWAYLTNAALVGGAEIDAEFVRLRQLARGERAEEVVLLPLRDTRRNRIIARQRDSDVASAHRIADEVRSRDKRTES
ncbi:MAG TPA: YihY/virulence factor BrkB family protein [Pseudolysinimonas sp.]|nr:YihY/virulence factor BrkB family protein [Pseudolysinimonas sp.]